MNEVIAAPRDAKPVAFKTDSEIANAAMKRPIQEIGAKLGIDAGDLLPYGHDKAKLSQRFINSVQDRPNGKLVLVTAINPTPAGEGKTTTTVGLGDGLNAIGKTACVCIREASLGPNFGMKGGAAGGGYAQVIPMEDMNLHFTGDFHAITSAHNLLSAMIDNHIYWGNEQDIDLRRVVWRRVVDMNDRALRQITCSLGGVANGFPRETGFDITVASEVMAILCLSRDLEDLQHRLGEMIVAYRRDKSPVYCRDIKADGAMTVLLKDAMQPNLVQTLENNPAFVHGGPFANIAHGCNSVIATTTALKLADYVVTEAGFGADLGAEKFFDIKCRKAGIAPDVAVIVATVRALKMNGGVAKADLGPENVAAVKKGLVNLGRHIANVKSFGVPVIVAINHFVSDTDAEVQAVQDYARQNGVEAILCKHWADGSQGTLDLARKVVEIAEKGAAEFAPLYPDEMPLFAKIETIAKRIYHADEVIADSKIRAQLKDWEEQGYGHLPICMAKTQYSFTTDPTRRGAPTGHSVPIREVRLAAGAGFIVAICGEVMTMPGLPRTPAAEVIGLNPSGEVQGLF
ncbi:formate--tetrahydrofolate ligase [Paracoccus zhejiangensis]|uniref:Formate--tetrahydrofolate ligase n=1 Tax=Paracoccus zhejiangensis TaxID=1077935 RepID=A0A2H5EW96_9RHOB|nr:formate--tetrahydrofolate ligase [Paracoccus zhejiangensis]AUH63575.1 formate--tetrahydrofolate ligase [Paracoccus zhejiangensis]